MEKEMEKEKNIFIMVDSNMKENFQMGKNMEREKNMIYLMDYFLRENL